MYAGPVTRGRVWRRWKRVFFRERAKIGSNIGSDTRVRLLRRKRGYFSPLPPPPRDLFLEPRWNGTLYLVRSLNPLARMISEKRSRTVVQHGDRACTNLQSLSRYVSRKEGAAKPPNRARVNDYKLAGRSVPIPGLIE